MMRDLATLSEDELLRAVAFLANAEEAPDLGDLADCPAWVRECATDYIRRLLEPEPEPIDTFIAPAKTNYEKRQRAKLLAVRAAMFDRFDWLEGKDCADLREEFGRRDALPDWVAEAAAREVKQQIFNLSTGQRHNPGERL